MTTAQPSAIEHRIGPDGLLAIRLDEGDIRISGVDGDRATVRGAGGDGIDGLDVEPGERSLAISTGGGPGARHGRKRSSASDLLVEMPAGATLVLESRNGDVRTVALTGETRITSASGDVTVRDAGGTVVIDAVSGDVEIDAPAPVDVVARTVSGDLDITAGVMRRLEAATTSGDLSIEATFDGDGPYMIESVSGDTSLTSNGPVRVEATTLTGDLHGPGSGHHPGTGSTALGGATGPTVTFRSTSGDLSLTIADAAHAAPREDDPTVEAREPATSSDPHPSSLDVLRALERGEIDVAEAADRLDALDREEPSDA